MSAETSLEIWLFPIWQKALNEDTEAGWKEVADALYYAQQGCTAGGGIGSDAYQAITFLNNVAFQHRLRTPYSAGISQVKRRSA